MRKILVKFIPDLLSFGELRHSRPARSNDNRKTQELTRYQSCLYVGGGGGMTCASSRKSCGRHKDISGTSSVQCGDGAV